MKNHHEQIGHIIKEFRVKSGLTQMELASKLGYNTPQFVSLFERGLSKIPLETMGKLIVYLKLPERSVMSALTAAFEQEAKQKVQSGKKAAR